MRHAIVIAVLGLALSSAPASSGRSLYPPDVTFKTRSGAVWCAMQRYGVVCQTTSDLVVQAGVDGDAEIFRADELDESLPPRRSIRRVIHIGQTVRAHGFRCYAAKARLRCHPAGRKGGLFVLYSGGGVGQL